MRFSIKVQYGLQAMLELAQKHGDKLVRIGEIARNQKIPARFLEQLMLILKRRHLISSARGKRGGYMLNKPPGEISVLEIVEALEGPLDLASKKMKHSQIIFEIFEKLQNNIKNELAGLTLEDLVIKKRQKDQTNLYSI